VQITISRETHDKLRRAQDLLRHVIPNGDPAAIFERALTLLVEDLERKKLAAAKRPRAEAKQAPGSRHVPAAVKREVWARDEARCAFIGAAGRCSERGFLELHHVVPFADGGATDAANLQVRCRSHNAHEAEEWFGPLVVREVRAAYSVRPELLVSSTAWPTTQGSSGLNRRGIQPSAAPRSPQAATDAMPSG
jgi:5-methylcytosine-specific restriction endonuclease McrA